MIPKLNRSKRKSRAETSAMIFQLQIFCSMEYLEREISNESTGYSRDQESMETASFAILVDFGGSKKISQCS